MKRKKRQIIGDIGETSTALIFKEWGWTADKIISDYGEDLDCQVFINNIKTHYHFRCQIKSTIKNDKYIRKLKNGDFSVTIKIGTARTWLLAYYPIFLIIYDESLKSHYWINANNKIKRNFLKLSQKSINLKIPSYNNLINSKDKLLSEIKNFYVNILRIDSPILKTEIYPVIMPDYISISLNHFKNLPKSEYFKIEPSSENVTKLPSWFLNINTLNPPYMLGFNIFSKEDNIEEYINNIKLFINDISIKLKESEWVSFIIAPIKMESVKDDDRLDDIWNKNITDWFSLSRIGNKIYFDTQYAFQPPEGFYSQIARKAMSYETFHHINPLDDVAIELFSSIKTPISYKYEMNTFYKQIESQFLPWKVKSEDEQVLLKQLPNDLTFSKVEGIENLAGYLRGIISRNIFNPILGLFHSISNWDELNENSIRNSIRQLSNNKKIVGEEDDQKTSDLIFTFFEGFNKVEEKVDISEKDNINGYPLDLSDRMIFIQRYRKIKSADFNIIDRKLANAIDELKKNHDLLDIHSGFQEVDEYTPDILIYRIYFHWKPPIKDTSRDSYQKLKLYILKVFDEIFPREQKKKDDNTTYDILRFCGQLYFQEIEN